MVMATDVSAIRTYFAKLGLEKEIADIYLALHTYGPQTISQLSRNAAVERTRIYRLIDQLMESNLIEVESQHKRGVIKAAPIANLHILIAQKEQELKSLQDELGLIEQVLARNSLSSSVASVQFYEGPTAAKLVRQNILHAQTEVCLILLKDIVQETDTHYATQWHTAAHEKDLQIRTLIDEQLRLSYQEKLPGADTEKVRFVPEQIYPVLQTTFIYDDVVASLQWQDKMTFGMEIHNSNMATAHRAYFELIWRQALPLG
jgi:sugar-specific transcriptional regulator TrmB